MIVATRAVTLIKCSSIIKVKKQKPPSAGYLNCLDFFIIKKRKQLADAVVYNVMSLTDWPAAIRSATLDKSEQIGFDV